MRWVRVDLLDGSHAPSFGSVSLAVTLCSGQTTALFLGPEPATEVHLGRVIWSPWILLARLLRGEQRDGVFF